MGVPHFTSDFHFKHKHAVEFNNRPWRQDENTERLIDIWNSQVLPGDTVYHLGDFAFLNRNDLLTLIALVEVLNGTKVFILGNHDSERMWSKLRAENLSRIYFIGDYKFVGIEGQKVVMTHYPFEVWRDSHYGSWHLHGHCHGSMPTRGKRLDVGIDNHPEHKLFTFDEVQTHMDAQEIWAPDHHGKERLRVLA